MLSITEGEFHARDLAEALGISTNALYARHSARVKRHNRVPSLAELMQPLRFTHRAETLKRFRLKSTSGFKYMTMPELATATNLPEHIVRARYASLARKYPSGFTLAELLRVPKRKRRAMTPRNALIIKRCEAGETFKAIGADFNMSRQAVQQIYKRGY